MFEEWQASPVEGGSSGEHTVTVPGKPEALSGRDAISYKTRFPDPREPGDEVALLELRGLYAHSELSLTGERLDGEGDVEHTNYFEPCRIAFEPYEENELVVICRTPDDRFGGIYDSDLVPEAERVPGIWWDARIEGRPLPYIEDIEVRPELTDAGARLHVTLTVVGNEALSERVTYSLKPEGSSRRSGMMERARVETSGPGRERVEHTIEMRDPARWWPRELGEQNRYTIRATLGESEQTVTTGIRSLEHDGGQLRVNGEPLSIRGINLLGGTVEDIERARELNATIVRAHASVLPEACYERCDSEGLVVWQDLPLTGPGRFDADRGQAIARALERRQARHPSVGVYTVHDDPLDAFADGLGSGFLDRVRLRVRAWRSSYDHTAAEQVAGAFPDSCPVVPVVGSLGVGGDGGSYYPGWDYGEPADISSLLDRYPADVVTEYGAGALADTPVEDAAGFDASKHARHAETPEESQAYQAHLLQTVTEQLRISEVGSLAFALRDTDRAGMGVYTRDGEPKDAADVLSRSLQPIQAFLADSTPGESDVVVINDLPKAFDVTVSWRSGEERGSFEATVGERDRWRDGPVPISQGEAVELTLSVGEHRIENRYEL